jgi:hypothetical protein
MVTWSLLRGGEVEVLGEAGADVEGDGGVVEEAGDGLHASAEEAQFVFGLFEEVGASTAELGSEAFDVGRVGVSHRIP